ncbi:hypothetical protein D6C79_03364 [Aureobasidium pullulans]|nr:hypothetical protein D6C79_03364 [Aureobasidium pullulans]
MIQQFHTGMARYFLTLASLAAFAAAGYNFEPEHVQVIEDPSLPVQYSLQDSQLISPLSTAFNSYWYATFLTSTDDKQYAVLSQTIAAANGLAVLRTSVLDLNNTENYWQQILSDPYHDNSTLHNGRLHIDASTHGIVGLSNDSISTMGIWASANDFAYNFTIKATSPVLLNGGAGVFSWADGETRQWSLPSYETSGELTIGNHTLEVNTTNSLTWYDRQHGVAGVNGQFTWFGIQFPGSDIKASMWYTDNTGLYEQHLKFITVRKHSGVEIVGYNITEEGATWTSQRSNLTYPLAWSIWFDNGDFLRVESVRDDQEIYAPGQLTAISAFASVKGRFFGQEVGYALVDNVPGKGPT